MIKELFMIFSTFVSVVLFIVGLMGLDFLISKWRGLNEDKRY